MAVARKDAEQLWREDNRERSKATSAIYPKEPTRFISDEFQDN